MNVRIQILVYIFFGFCISACPVMADPSAREVMEQVDNRENGDTLTSDTLMVLMDKNNQKRIRNIKSIRKDYGPDTKGIIFFLSPANVRNTAYMSHNWDDGNKEDDSWLYLPALAKVKRIAAGDKSNAFMGSDFTYSDINGIEIDDWEYVFVKENFLLNGKETWVIGGTPRKESKQRVIEETGYLKSMIWIQKENLVAVKAKYWVQAGKKIKYFKAEALEKIDGIWTPLQLTMVTTSRGKVEHSSLLKISNLRYNLPVKDNTFTTRNMEQGL